jgi:hypothetical protein
LGGWRACAAVIQSDAARIDDNILIFKNFLRFGRDPVLTDHRAVPPFVKRSDQYSLGLNLRFNPSE